jgi:two-component system, sensor histidine kinase PdtaS
MQSRSNSTEQQLRQRAERQLSGGKLAGRERIGTLPEGEAPGDLSDEQKDALIHELQVHQVELEIQNDELRRTQQLLETTRDRYAYLYHSAPVGYLSIDANGTIVQHNTTLLEMIGADGRDLRDTPFASLLTDEGRRQFLARFKAFFNHPEDKSMEVQLRTPRSGERTGRFLRLTGRRSLFNASGEVVTDADTKSTEGLLLTVTDITAGKESDRRIRSLLREKDLLMQEIHHRVKNNLNTIISMLSLQAGNARHPDAAAVIRQAGERVRSMMSIYAHLQDSRDYRNVDLGVYLGILVDAIVAGPDGGGRPVLRRQLASVEVSTARAVSLGIIVNELVSDACKHAFPDGAEGHIEITLRRGSENDIVLIVQDDGVGMSVPADEISSGGGFGLLLVRSQVEQHRGSFRVESADPGTRFIVTIPASSAARA